ncbi:MAG: glycosyltransferase family 4 protein [Desulfobacterota bacterium]|nr:glycosyltransferase family 4 protein [Thermodesulfobacteriota bacterium]
MKIALIRKKYTPFGGAETFVQHLAEALTAGDHEVHILAQAWDPPGGKAARAPTLHPIPPAFGPYWWQALAFARRVKNLVGSAPFDLVHSFERTYSQDVYRAGDGCHREFLRQRSRYVAGAKRASFKANPHHWVTLWLERQTFTHNPRQEVIANSRRGKAEILKYYPVPEQRIRVIHNALPAWPEAFVPPRAARGKLNGLGLEPVDRVLLFLGSGFERKGLPLVLDGLRRLDDPRVKLLVIGRDREAPYRALANRYHLGNRVFFLGPQTNPGPFYRAADVFVLPSYYEPFSNACLEALSFGLPVVTSARNGVAEVLEPGVNGVILADLHDGESLAAGIRETLNWDREHLFRKNQEGLGGAFTFAARIREFLDCYEQVLSRKGTRTHG